MRQQTRRRPAARRGIIVSAKSEALAAIRRLIHTPRPARGESAEDREARKWRGLNNLHRVRREQVDEYCQETHRPRPAPNAWEFGYGNPLSGGTPITLTTCQTAHRVRPAPA